MKKISKKILLAALAVGTSHLHGATGKTYLSPRATNVNLALEKSGGWHHLLEQHDKKSFGFNLQAVAFYADHGKNQGRYFLVNNKDTIQFGQGAAAGGIRSGLTADADLDLNAILHRRAGAAKVNAGTLKLTPEQEIYGTHFYYHQALCKLLSGLYFDVSVPITHVKNKMNAVVTGDIATGNPNEYNLISYLAGKNLSALTGANLQNPLTNALIVNEDHKTSVADIDVRLGYDLLNVIKKDGFRGAINFGFTAPTSSRPTGKKLFEAHAGNQRHWAVGCGLDADLRVWGDHEHGVKVYTALDYRYLFESAERRTFSLKTIPGAEGYTGDFSQYTLLAATGAKAGTPAANYTTLKTDVTPGSQLDFVAAAAYHNTGFTFDLGYNLFYREEEALKLNDTLTTGLGIVAVNHNLTTAVDLTNAGHNILQAARGATGNSLTNDDLNIASAQTPAMTTHKFYAGVGYVTERFEVPFMMGFGGHYEWRGSSNAGLQGWGINGRLGVGF